MPYLFKGISRSAPAFQAWRWAFFVPGAMHVLVAVLILAFGQVLLSSLKPHLHQVNQLYMMPANTRIVFTC